MGSMEKTRKKIEVRVKACNEKAEQENDELIQGKLYQLKLRHSSFAKSATNPPLGYTFRLSHGGVFPLPTIKDVLAAEKKITLALKSNEHLRNSGDLFKPINKAIFGQQARANIHYPFYEPVLLWKCKILFVDLGKVIRKLDLYIRGNLYKNVIFSAAENNVKFVRVGKFS